VCQAAINFKPKLIAGAAMQTVEYPRCKSAAKPTGLLKKPALSNKARAADSVSAEDTTWRSR
jgi:hypothetical protein